LKKYLEIVKHYERCFDRHDDTHLGVDWPNKEDALVRYQVMLDLIQGNKNEPALSLLDFGCGAAHLYDFIQRAGYDKIRYTGLDLSEKFISACKKKYPEIEFLCGDILDEHFKTGSFDYVVMNGVFTEKRDLSFDEMWAYFKRIITEIYSMTSKGIAFNVMSKQVDWERDDLFHVPLDLMADFLCKKLTRDFIIRNDYGLYEYTVYVYVK